MLEKYRALGEGPPVHRLKMVPGPSSFSFFLFSESLEMDMDMPTWISFRHTIASINESLAVLVLG